MDKIKTEDEKIRESEDFLFEFEGFLYYTETHIQGRDRIETRKLKEKRVGIRRRTVVISLQDFIDILRPYLESKGLGSKIKFKNLEESDK